MIRKIKNDSYLKRYGNMTASEQSSYETRVGEWLAANRRRLADLAETPAARFQDVLMASAGWNDAECRAFEDGVQMMTALAGILDTGLPDVLYAKSARRAVIQMVRCLDSVIGKKDAGVPQPAPAQEKAEVAREGSAGAVPQGKAVGIPARPRHIDQYVHLFPEKVRQHASQVKGLLRELDEARENARKLMEAGGHADKVAAWSKTAQRIDGKVGAIYRELDSEWEKLVSSGRVALDDFGNAHVVEPKGDDACTEPSGEETQDMTSEQKSRRRELRKWLVDMRRGNGNTRKEHVKKWKAAFKEYVGLEGDAAYQDEKIAEAAGHYGIRIKK